MRVLVIGGGGREHALAWKIGESPLVEEIFCLPGNPGTTMLKKCANVPIAITEIDNLLNFSIDKKVGLAVIGPEDPLVAGIVDKFEIHGIPAFGPSERGALLEGSKEFAKKLMKKYGILTANYEVFTDSVEAKRCVSQKGLSCVIKADGLTGGKGVSVYKTIEEAHKVIDGMMTRGIYGKAGRKILIEDRLVGREISYLFFTDGKNILPMELSEDHKQLLDEDEGPNTGGMGVYSPARLSSGLEKQMKKIAKRLVYAMNKENLNYKGICYIGFMICDGELFVLEINCRFGDPETQPYMMRIKNDIVPILLACTDETLGRHKIEWDSRSAVCVVLAAEGYPDNPVKGTRIYGLEKISQFKDVQVFHSGTVWDDNILKTNGGRVLGVTALGKDNEAAAKRAYEAVGEISFEGMQYRGDISRRSHR